MREMAVADDRYKYATAIESNRNTEAAMQSWRQKPFPERQYERLSEDKVCDGLSELDERIATYERKTSLPDSFVGISYRYDDTGQSEAWMKSVVDETGSNSQDKDEARRAALALAADDGVTRAQVVATMQTLLIGVQDRVMTDMDILHQPELRSANWEVKEDEGFTNEKPVSEARTIDANNVPLSEGALSNGGDLDGAPAQSTGDASARGQVVGTMERLLVDTQDRLEKCSSLGVAPDLKASAAKPVTGPSEAVTMPKQSPVTPEEAKASKKSSVSVEVKPEIVEQPVWGMDRYSIRNISFCLQVDFDPVTVVVFIEKWLLPAINACPPELAQDLANAARLLEGLPFVSTTCVADTTDTSSDDGKAASNRSQTILGTALRQKIESCAPPWLKAAANKLRRARTALGPDFFRIHPKGHGSVLLSPKVEAHRLVTFYRGELYPSWRWGEKMDAIDLTQQRKNLKPALPDFYNMALERPQTDPRGYGLLYVDASRKAGHGSALSHSCDPTCEVRVAAKNGELCLAMTTLRELEMGEELTFDYNAVTESLNEYTSAVCLCGYKKCRGSFLHFATADCYQQVLNRNAPIATRFSDLVRGSMKQVMSEDDDLVLRNHGFHTAAFGAISVNRREASASGVNDSLVDSLETVPVWLKTYVADALRYIEYERRALPISLICEHLSTVKRKKEDKASSVVPLKEPGREPSFFYFSRVEHEFLRSLLRKKGFPESANGLELKHAMQKVASAYWQSLADDKKQYWKCRAQADYEKKRKAWLAQRKGSKPPKGSKGKMGSKKSFPKAKPEISDVLHKSKISFEDADAEGVSAMEQRIQQLTQTLSRVGRVLDRHREGILEANGASYTDVNGRCDLQTLRQLVHSPLSVLEDERVVGWIWSSSEGVVSCLFRNIQSSPCVRPALVQRLTKTKEKYPLLESFADPTSEPEVGAPAPPNGSEGRQQLKCALLDMRNDILKELKQMAKEFRRYRAESKSKAGGPEKAEENTPDKVEAVNEAAEPGSEKAPSETPETWKADTEEIGTGKAETEKKETAKGARDTEHEKAEKPGKRDVASDQVDCADDASQVRMWTPNLSEDRSQESLPDTEERSIVRSIMVELIDQVVKRVFVGKTKTSVSVLSSEIKQPPLSLDSDPWLEHYSQRFTLQAAADVLLFYAHTNNFFVLDSYHVLESTPVEVYAREIGNAVPRSIVDDSIDAGPGGNSEGFLGASSDQESVSVLATNSISCDSPKSDNLSESTKQNNDAPAPTDSSANEMKTSDRTEGICQPDDIVASVSVRYQGDYVLSQLLQWYNGGIGQKPGLPDLLGCTLLPSMQGCWSSALLEKNKLKPEKRTTYEVKLRRRLIEWMQDPYQRGNPWPEDVRQAFEQSDEDIIKREDASSRFVAFGCPIVDFLVTGDESSIHRVLGELDADDKVASRKKSDGLLSSLDKGRPAQAVSTWVQCENPDCLKWRKIPWHVDVDLLPEKFYCKDNKWNPASNSCDAPEDDWDFDDSLVDANGKVEGSPARKRKTGSLSPLDEKNFIKGGRCFFVGMCVGASLLPPSQQFFCIARFDVRRQGKGKYCTGVVTKVDFSGRIKRIHFHFTKTHAKYDEWIEFGSDRIARLGTKVLPPVAKGTKKEKGEKPPKLPKESGKKNPEAQGGLEKKSKTKGIAENESLAKNASKKTEIETGDEMRKDMKSDSAEASKRKLGKNCEEKAPKATKTNHEKGSSTSELCSATFNGSNGGHYLFENNSGQAVQANPTCSSGLTQTGSLQQGPVVNGARADVDSSGLTVSPPPSNSSLNERANSLLYPSTHSQVQFTSRNPGIDVRDRLLAERGLSGQPTSIAMSSMQGRFNGIPQRDEHVPTTSSASTQQTQSAALDLLLLSSLTGKSPSLSHPSIDYGSRITSTVAPATSRPIHASGQTDTSVGLGAPTGYAQTNMPSGTNSTDPSAAYWEVGQRIYEHNKNRYTDSNPFNM